MSQKQQLLEVEHNHQTPPESGKKGPEKAEDKKPIGEPTPSPHPTVKVKIHKKAGTDIEIEVEDDDDRGNKKEQHKPKGKTCLLG